jgi:hypothetical protein
MALILSIKTKERIFARLKQDGFGVMLKCPGEKRRGLGVDQKRYYTYLTEEYRERIKMAEGLYMVKGGYEVLTTIDSADPEAGRRGDTVSGLRWMKKGRDMEKKRQEFEEALRAPQEKALAEHRELIEEVKEDIRTEERNGRSWFFGGVKR